MHFWTPGQAVRDGIIKRNSGQDMLSEVVQEMVVREVASGAAEGHRRDDPWKLMDLPSGA